MPPITWKNVTSPSTSGTGTSAAGMYSGGNDMIQAGLKQLGSVFTDYQTQEEGFHDKIVERNTNTYQDLVAGAKSKADLDALQPQLDELVAGGKIDNDAVRGLTDTQYTDILARNSGIRKELQAVNKENADPIRRQVQALINGGDVTGAQALMTDNQESLQKGQAWAGLTTALRDENTVQDTKLSDSLTNDFNVLMSKTIDNDGDYTAVDAFLTDNAPTLDRLGISGDFFKQLSTSTKAHKSSLRQQAANIVTAQNEIALNEARTAQKEATKAYKTDTVLSVMESTTLGGADQIWADKGYDASEGWFDDSANEMSQKIMQEVGKYTNAKLTSGEQNGIMMMAIENMPVNETDNWFMGSDNASEFKDLLTTNYKIVMKDYLKQKEHQSLLGTHDTNVQILTDLAVADAARATFTGNREGPAYKDLTKKVEALEKKRDSNAAAGADAKKRVGNISTMLESLYNGESIVIPLDTPPTTGDETITDDPTAGASSTASDESLSPLDQAMVEFKALNGQPSNPRHRRRAAA